MTLEALVSEVQAGNTACFDTLYYKTYRLVFYVVTRLVADHSAAEDIVQETYISAFEKLHTLNEPEKFQTWINRIAANKAKDHLKKRKLYVFSEIIREDQDDFEIEDVSVESRPDYVAAIEENRRILSEILETLPDEQRLCIFTYYFDEMTTKEIAASLRISENSVKSRLRYAKQKINEHVKIIRKMRTASQHFHPVDVAGAFNECLRKGLCVSGCSCRLYQRNSRCCCVC